MTFLACDKHSICLARYMLSPVRPSVRLSVRGWIVQKRLKLGLSHFSPHGSPMSLVFAR